jgi:hypothetical protein
VSLLRASETEECLSSSESFTFTSLLRAQDTGGGNPYIDTEGVLRLLIVGDSAVRLLITLGAHSAW